MNSINEISTRCKNLSFDLEFQYAKNWKMQETGRILVGYLPVYFPREIVHALNGLPVGILGGGNVKEVVKGDACFQSYICSLPRSTVEMALDGHFDNFDGLVFPSICDVMRNLSGIFKIIWEEGFVKYLDYPQNYNRNIGGKFYRSQLEDIITNITQINRKEIDYRKLKDSIHLFNKNRQLITEINKLRNAVPWSLDYESWYYIQRAGLVVDVEYHNEILISVLSSLKNVKVKPEDKIRAIVTGAFCEQPPVGLIRTIENAGCYIIDDDFLWGSRWFIDAVQENIDDPLEALINNYLNNTAPFYSVYENRETKEDNLLRLVKECKADGVIFASPSFCDPALLDRPLLQKACEREGVRYINVMYSEKTSHFKVVKEQVGAFADAVRLWD